MLFGTELKWWGDRGKRNSRHEGLDLLLYRNNDGQVLRLDDKTMVPAIYDGTVVSVIDDFLGRSIFMEHHSHGNRTFFTAFGHTRPLKGIKAGSKVKEGDIIATIAEISDPKIKITSHLHITAGWASGDLQCEMLNWETIVSSKVIKMVDPLDIIGGGSSLLESSFPVCINL
jgi:murein DD-endopeptidase MepM/ murein hydrolase activator NlpD